MKKIEKTVKNIDLFLEELTKLTKKYKILIPEIDNIISDCPDLNGKYVYEPAIYRDNNHGWHLHNKGVFWDGDVKKKTKTKKYHAGIYDFDEDDMGN